MKHKFPTNILGMQASSRNMIKTDSCFVKARSMFWSSSFEVDAPHRHANQVTTQAAKAVDATAVWAPLSTDVLHCCQLWIMTLWFHNSALWMQPHALHSSPKCDCSVAILTCSAGFFCKRQRWTQCWSNPSDREDREWLLSFGSGPLWLRMGGDINLLAGGHPLHLCLSPFAFVLEFLWCHQSRVSHRLHFSTAQSQIAFLNSFCLHQTQQQLPQLIMTTWLAIRSTLPLQFLSMQVNIFDILSSFTWTLFCPWGRFFVWCVLSTVQWPNPASPSSLPETFELCEMLFLLCVVKCLTWWSVIPLELLIILILSSSMHAMHTCHSTAASFVFTFSFSVLMVAWWKGNSCVETTSASTTISCMQMPPTETPMTFFTFLAQFCAEDKQSNCLVLPLQVWLQKFFCATFQSLVALWRGTVRNFLSVSYYF